MAFRPRQQARRRERRHGAPEALRGREPGCDGLQVDHRDGSMSCTRGEACAGVALDHRGWRDCDVPDCDFCAGRILWVCDRS